ncbi:MAG: aspartate kinase [Acidimicrobiia bacterium]|nr:aspartate kinase [Acidimicrobiia bacterium]MDH5615498.1 aspartate kinase [Acidimicrobiia bacterium]
MSLIVQKYGGTSVADAERIRRVAARVATTRRAGNDVIVVVSAMGGTTDQLIDLARQVSPSPPGREMDMLLTAGERIAMALLAIAIHEEGVEAVSFTGSQAGILTDSSHGQAKIQEIRSFRVQESLKEGKVVIVAGFQGVDPESKDVTTLGRGGSDATAVALAAANHADVCEIYTDVDGVFTADPRIVADARKLDEVSFEEMLELAATGAKVLMLRSVEFGRNFNIPLHVRSSFHDGPGTWVKETTMEQAIISAISHDTSEAKVTVRGVPDRPGVAAALFEPLAAREVNVDMIVQNVSEDGTTDISFTVPTEHVPVAKEVTEKVIVEIEAAGVDVDEAVARVSVVGAGMKSHPGVAAKMFRVLASNGINIEMISTSSIRISCVVALDQIEEAVRVLHAAFEPPRMVGGL